MNLKKLALVWIVTLTLGALVKAEEPLKALLVAGGCCHDYQGQHKVIAEGIQARANVQVDVVWTDDRSTNPPLPLYDQANWADGYDIVIHDECAADNRDVATLERILAVHKTKPAVHLHCAMHSFRNGTKLWFEHLGLRSTGHGPQLPIELRFAEPDHPIFESLVEWTTGNEELYNSPELLGGKPLAYGQQLIKRKGEEKAVEHVVAWTHDRDGVRSFSTTLGHNTSTVGDDRYLDLITRGLLWSAKKLNDAPFVPFKGQNKVTFVKSKPLQQAKAKPLPTKAPEEATLVTLTASSTQDQRFPWMAVDGDSETRWCASDGSKPQSLQLEFDQPTLISEVVIDWENRQGVYGYRLDGSLDGQTWNPLYDGSTNAKRGQTKAGFAQTTVKHLRLTGLSSSSGWISLWEIKVKGPKIKSLFPKLSKSEAVAAKAAKEKANDPYAKQGNVPPRIIKLTAEEEQAILADVKVPEEFEVSLFAPSQTANYPVYVAASPGGDLYVSSDGNGSLGRDPHRGRVLRLRDTNGDGRADEVKEFIKDIDSPRGLIWDHDRLYLLHPPHISVFYDRDHDGVAEDSQRLIEGIAFGFEDRPADHTTNGLEIGLDGWIYIAGGDFGFLNATGTDGRQLQHRGGGVIRFRPDGTGLELFATGTRNILGTPMSPLLDLFARDNTNDGGGWDVRFHHFTGLEDHGYPRLYKNFEEEHIQPLADYGGGSGCGSVYIHEPGFPDRWNNAPFTCDWGRAASFHHSVIREGASFKEVSKPQPFIQMTRPTDADVDGLSQVYQASWKGPGTFKWGGADQGYIVRVSPKDYAPEPLPNFDQLTDLELIQVFKSPSHIRALAAQRTLLRRNLTPATLEQLIAFAEDTDNPLRARIAALYAVSQRGTDHRNSQWVLETIIPLAGDPLLSPFVYRALGDLGLARLTNALPGPVAAHHFEQGLLSADPRTCLEAIVATTRQGNRASAAAIAQNLGHSDPRIAHTAFRALAKLGSADACFEVLDSSGTTLGQKQGAAYALMRMPRPDVVSRLLDRLSSQTSSKSRRLTLSALCRLYHKEAEWKGDSWGTRPDTRGPYYQLATWSESQRILTSLQAFLERAPSEEAAFLVAAMNSNRIQSNEALNRILDLAIRDEGLVGPAITQLASSESLPQKGIALLLKASSYPNLKATDLAETVAILARVDHPKALEASLDTLARLDGIEADDRAKERARMAFLKAPNLDSQYQAFVGMTKVESDAHRQRWSYAALLEIASREKASPEALETARSSLDLAWQSTALRKLLMTLASETRNHHLDARISAALSDLDPEVVEVAQRAARRLRLPAPGEDTSPRVVTLSAEETLAKVVAFKGDVTLGESVFLRAGCQACHTVNKNQALKGPYLGSIADTYRRRDLIESILDPNQSIAQGFVTHLITLKNDAVYTGFVTKEAASTVTLRDITSQEHTLDKSQIRERTTLPTSIMPPGLMNPFTVKEFASLIDYLESLVKKE